MKINSILFLIIIILLIFYLLRSAGRNSKAIDYIFEEKLYTSNYNGEIEEVINLLLRGTKYENKYQINKKPKPNSVNLFIINPDSSKIKDFPKGFENFINNCVYIGEKNSIVIDIKFINYFLTKYEENSIGYMNYEQRLEYKNTKKNEREQWFKESRRSLLIWVLGHELGHMMLNHPLSHFAKNKLSDYVKTSTIKQKKEFQADSFLVSRVLNDKELSNSMVGFFIGVLNGEIASKIGYDIPLGAGILYDYSNKKVVKYIKRGTHPEYVIRIARILDIVGNRKGNENIKAMTSSFIRDLKEEL